MSSLGESLLVKTLAFVLPLPLPVLVLGGVISSDNSDISFLVMERLEERDVDFTFL